MDKIFKYPMIESVIQFDRQINVNISKYLKVLTEALLKVHLIFDMRRKIRETKKVFGLIKNYLI